MRERRITQKIVLRGEGARGFVAAALVAHEGEKAKENISGPMLVAVEAELAKRGKAVES